MLAIRISFALSLLAFILAAISLAAAADTHRRTRPGRHRTPELHSELPAPLLPPGMEFHRFDFDPKSCLSPYEVFTLDGRRRIIECGKCRNCCRAPRRPSTGTTDVT